MSLLPAVQQYIREQFPGGGGSWGDRHGAKSGYLGTGKDYAGQYGKKPMNHPRTGTAGGARSTARKRSRGAREPGPGGGKPVHPGGNQWIASAAIADAGSNHH